MACRWLNLWKNEKGQSLVEFAIVVIPLLLLVLGIVEFGWLFNGQIVLTSSAREGARVAAVGGTETEIKLAVTEHVSGSAVSVADGSVNISKVGEKVTVTVGGQIEPLVGFFVHNAVNLTAEAVMRNE